MSAWVPSPRWTHSAGERQRVYVAAVGRGIRSRFPRSDVVDRRAADPVAVRDVLDPIAGLVERPDLGCLLGWRAAQAPARVDGLRHWFEVVGVAAGRDPAEVVQGHASGDASSYVGV